MTKKARQSPLSKLVRSECANRLPEDECLGVQVEDLYCKPERERRAVPLANGIPAAHTPWGKRKVLSSFGPTFPKKRCVVLAGGGCRYFRVCVIPLGDRMPEYEEAAIKYLCEHPPRDDDHLSFEAVGP